MCAGWTSDLPSCVCVVIVCVLFGRGMLMYECGAAFLLHASYVVLAHHGCRTYSKCRTQLELVVSACRSADVYEFSTETLFFGRQDAMQVGAGAAQLLWVLLIVVARQHQALALCKVLTSSYTHILQPGPADGGTLTMSARSAAINGFMSLASCLL